MTNEIPDSAVEAAQRVVANSGDILTNGTIRHALSAALPHLLAAQWRPIESAEKGQNYLVRGNDIGTTFASGDEIQYLLRASKSDGEPCVFSQCAKIPPTGESA